MVSEARNGLSACVARWLASPRRTLRLARRPRPAPAAGWRRWAIPGGTEASEVEVRLGEPPAALRPPVGQRGRGSQVRHPPGAGEFVQVGRDAVEDCAHPRKVDGRCGRCPATRGWAQVNRGRVAPDVELREPVRAASVKVRFTASSATAGLPAGRAAEHARWRGRGRRARVGGPGGREVATHGSSAAAHPV